jgi:hypothetical protein
MLNNSDYSVTPSGCSGLAGHGKSWILWGLESDILLVNVAIQVEVCFIGEPWDIQDAWIALH